MNKELSSHCDVLIIHLLHDSNSPQKQLPLLLSLPIHIAAPALTRGLQGTTVYDMNSTEPPTELSDQQDKTLSLLPILPACLSIWGSANIIYMVLSSEKRTPYRRLLFGLSCCDVISSITLALQPYLMPRGTAIWAVGNETSCDALGFFQQFSSSDIFYNGMLAIYFLLTVRYGLSEPTVARNYEPWMHASSVLWPLITGIIGAAIGLYNPLVIGHGW